MSRHELAKDVVLYSESKGDSDPFEVRYDIEVSGPFCYELTLQLGDSSNVALKSDAGAAKEDGTATLTLQPMERGTIAVLQQVNPEEGYCISPRFSWKQRPPGEEFVKKLAAALEEQVEMGHSFNFGADSWTIKDLRKFCKVVFGRGLFHGVR